MQKTEVRLVLRPDEIRLRLVKDGRTVDTEVFIRRSDPEVLKEIAQVIFDDAYDLVNYTADAIDE